MFLRKVILAASTLILLGVSAPARAADDSTGALAGCRTNLDYTKSALTMWFIDHQDEYPSTPDLLVPEYFKKLLRCPAAGIRPYSYQVGEGGKSFTATCPVGHGDVVPSVTNDPETEQMFRETQPPFEEN